MNTKTAILTFQRTANFGAVLQAYALWRKLQDLGCDCDILDYRCHAVERREGIGRKFPMTLKGILQTLLVQTSLDRKAKSLYHFLESQGAVSPSYQKADLPKANQKYGQFLVGSDMVWHLNITEDDTSFFLDFVDSSIPKFSYGSSAGDLSSNTSALHLLSQFQKLSVREESSAEALRHLLDREVSCVCDPTMLLTPEEWNRYGHPKAYKGRYVLVYFPGAKSLQDAREYAKRYNCKVKLITSQLRPIPGVQSISPSNIEEFLGLIKHATFVFTASYHGMLFASYYHRPFLFYTRGSGGDNRVLNLAKKLGLDACHGNGQQSPNYGPIDYDYVDKLTDVYRQDSIRYLKSILTHPVNISQISKENCCGCTACQFVCPVNAIEMKPDDQGFLYPSVKETCIHCGLCLKVCREKPHSSSRDIHAYAVRHRNTAVLKRSSSGGVATAMAENIIRQGGTVYGVAYDERYRVITRRASTVSECESFCGSKYVQTDLCHTVRDVSQDLLAGIPVLYFGTSCHVQGLLNALDQKRIDRKKLVTVDLFCHGVPSPGLFAEYIDLLKKERPQFQSFAFRTKLLPWGQGSKSYGTQITYKNGKTELDTPRARAFLYLFFSNCCLRPYCYQCPYCSSDKPADITIADYWGLQEAHPDFFSTDGVSAVLVRSDAGDALLKSLDDIEYIPSTLEQIGKKQPNLHAPSPKSDKYEQFWEDYHRRGFRYILNRYGNYSLKARTKRLIKKYILKK